MALVRDLRPYPLADAIQVLIGKTPGVVVTMGVDQWTSLHAEAYRAGLVLIELDDDEVPVAAYRKVAD